MKDEGELELDRLSGYVTCVYESEWWLACVLGVDSENAKVKLNFLHPYGPTSSYHYPAITYILSVPSSDLFSQSQHQNCNWPHIHYHSERVVKSQKIIS